MHWELPDVQAQLRKGRGTRDQIVNIHWIIEKAGNSRKTSTSASLTILKPLSLWITTNRKILQELGIPDHSTCLLRNVYASQETTEPDMEQWTGSKLGKKCIKPVYCHKAYITYAEYLMRNAGLDEAQTGIKISRRNTNNLRYADDTTLMAESEEELKSLLMKVKEESENVGLKLNVQKIKIMASGPITSWQKRWGNNGNSKRLNYFALQITTDGDCSHEIKRHLLLGRKAMKNLDSVWKSRDITF